MHKKFYASGFIYYPPTQQILLQQLESDSSQWSLFGGVAQQYEPAASVFQRIVYQQIDIRLLQKAIYPIYDYFSTELNAHQFVFFAEIKGKEVKTLHKEDKRCGWFAFKKLHKIFMNEKSRQDIVVGQRVINAIERNRLTAHS